MRTGSCKFGAACKFHHPQPASSGNVLPVTGPPFMSTGSSIGPSSSLPFVGTLPAWSFPRAPYLSGPRVPGPQAYIPVVLSPPPAILPAQGWSTYMVSYFVKLIFHILSFLIKMYLVSVHFQGCGCGNS